ncbi:MAG: hypothetical protein IBJ15_00140 [Alphaproteobacteria bacterium]|nr:hypothetical protein [Alphaproteobacteria bacterium]
MARSLDGAGDGASRHAAEIDRILAALPDREAGSVNLERLAYAFGILKTGEPQHDNGTPGEEGIRISVNESEVPKVIVSLLGSEPSNGGGTKSAIDRGLVHIGRIVEKHRDALCKLRDHPAFKNRDMRTLVGLIAAIIDISGGAGAAALAVAIYYYGLDNVCAGKTPVLT